MTYPGMPRHPLNPPRLTLMAVLAHRFVDVHGLAEIVGIKKQTVHNMQSTGRLGVDPVGQLLFPGVGPMIYLRDDAGQWAAQRVQQRKKAST